MKSIIFRLLSVLAALFFLNANAGIFSSDSEPSEDDISNALASQLSVPWVVDSIDVVAIVNVGDAVEPIWKFRFNVVTQLSENTYRSSKILMYDILEIVRRKGEEVTLSGLGVFKLGVTEWEHKLVFDDAQLRDIGKTRSSFGKNIVLSDSPKASKIMKQHEALSKELTPVITDHYNNKGVWAGSYILKAIEHIRLEQEETQDAIVAHVQYRFLCVDRKKCANDMSGVDKRWFSIQRTPSGEWSVTSMGDHMSGSL